MLNLEPLIARLVDDILRVVRQASVVASVAAAGCAAVPAPPPFGAFASTGGQLGRWTTQADWCSAGVRRTAVGTTTIARFARGARGRGGTWYESSGFSLAVGVVGDRVTLIEFDRLRPWRELELGREQCSRADVVLHPRPDGAFAADVDLDCDAGDGSRVSASIHAPSCS